MPNQEHDSTESQQEQINNLLSLWQAQPVSEIDLEAVKKSFNEEQRKQRLYMVVDSLAFLPAVYMVVVTWGELSFAMKAMCMLLFILATPMLVYQLWLRRIAAFAKNSDTFDHLQQFTKQIKNNIRIAFITKHSGWPALLFIPGFAYLRYLSGDLSVEKLTQMGIVFAVLSIGIAGWTLWAHKRQKRFEQQLKTLHEMADKRGY